VRALLFWLLSIESLERDDKGLVDALDEESFLVLLLGIPLPLLQVLVQPLCLLGHDGLNLASICAQSAALGGGLLDNEHCEVFAAAHIRDP